MYRDWETILNEQKLETLDKIRDEILKQPGNIALDMTATKDDDVNNLFIAIRTAATEKLGGLVLKTYDSDIFNRQFTRRIHYNTRNLRGTIPRRRNTVQRLTENNPKRTKAGNP